MGIDGQPFLAWTDPEPLAGPGHEYLAINDWESDVTFDNLPIRPPPERDGTPAQHPLRPRQALAGLAGRKSVLVYMHDNPDPDSLAAALGLKKLLEHELGARVTLGHGGIVGRAQNRAMVETLGMPLAQVERSTRTPSTSSPSSTASRRRETTRCRPDTASTWWSTTTRPPRQRPGPLVRHPPRFRRHLDDRVRLPAARGMPSTSRWRRPSSSRCGRRRATSAANRPGPNAPHTWSWSRWSTTGCFTE